MSHREKPSVGDLIEIFRPGYQHWAIYVGDGYVIHLAPPSEMACAGVSSVMSVLSDYAVVKKEELWEVVGNDEYKVNNLLDKKYKPRDIAQIVKEAHRLVGSKQPYCLFSKNCEHFVTGLRYGKPKSRQVQVAVGVGVSLGVLGLLAVGITAALSTSKKEEKDKYCRTYKCPKLDFSLYDLLKQDKNKCFYYP